MNIDIELYMILFLLYILLYNLFIDVYNKYYVKFIVVSNNKNNKLKIHTKPISLTKALEIQRRQQQEALEIQRLYIKILERKVKEPQTTPIPIDKLI